MDYRPLVQTHDPMLVALSIGLAVATGFVVLEIAGRLFHSARPHSGLWLVVASLILGGGTWSSHFLGLLALRLPVEIHYDAAGTVITLLLAIAVAAAGLAVCRRGGRPRLILGGVVLGAGLYAVTVAAVGTMSMAATPALDPLPAVGTFVLAVATSTAALLVLRHRRFRRRRLAATIGMGSMIAALHYPVMAQVRFYGTGALDNGAGGIRAAELAMIVSVAAGVILLFCWLTAVFDRRYIALADREAEMLRRSEQRFRALVRTSSDLIIVLDRDLTVTYVTSSSVRTIGVEPEELMGWPLADMLLRQYRDDFNAALADLRAGKVKKARVEVGIRDATGVYRLFELTARDLTHEPSVAGIVTTLHDVTRERRAAEEMLKAKDLADQANRAKSEFIANMSHELRTPLNAIIGFSEMIREKTFGPLGNPHYADYVDDIHASGRHLLDIVNNILDITRIEAGEMDLEEGPVDPARVLADASSMLRVRAEAAGVTLESAWPALPVIQADERKLKQIVVNLLSNAVKFTPRGGAVTVSGWVDDQSGLVLSVEDTGIGIAAKDIAMVRQPFRQVDGSISRKYEGSGLGLAIASALAELHGGTIDIESVLGQGTTVSLRLPAWRLERPEAATG